MDPHIWCICFHASSALYIPVLGIHIPVNDLGHNHAEKIYLKLHKSSHIEKWSIHSWMDVIHSKLDFMELSILMLRIKKLYFWLREVGLSSKPLCLRTCVWMMFHSTWAAHSISFRKIARLLMARLEWRIFSMGGVKNLMTSCITDAGLLYPFQLKEFTEWANIVLSCKIRYHKNSFRKLVPYSKVHGVNMGPTWVLSAPDGPRVGPMNLAIRDHL